MIKGHAVLGLITARGGSKGLRGKNILPLGGKPLLAWTIEAARNSRFIDRLVLSSEDEKIIEVARDWHCEVPFRRPPELARDDSTSMDVVRHALANLPAYDLLVLLQPTSPLRSANDIDESIEDCVSKDRPATITVTLSSKPPQWMYMLDAERRLKPILPGSVPHRRQDAQPVYAANGAVYVARTDWILASGDFVSPETGAIVMPRERSIDIDDALDLAFAELIISQSRQGA